MRVLKAKASVSLTVGRHLRQNSLVVEIVMRSEVDEFLKTFSSREDLRDLRMTKSLLNLLVV